MYLICEIDDSRRIRVIANYDSENEAVHYVRNNPHYFILKTEELWVKKQIS